MKICPYCGNKSGLVDRLGGCVTCGGQLDTVPTPSTIPIQNGWMTVSEARQMLGVSPYNSVSGGYSRSQTDALLFRDSLKLAQLRVGYE